MDWAEAYLGRPKFKKAELFCSVSPFPVGARHRHDRAPCRLRRGGLDALPSRLGSGLHRRRAAFAPVIDRTLVKDPKGLLHVFVKGILTADQMESVKMPDDQLFGTFTLSKEDIQRVKDVITGEARRHGAAPPRCSSLVATFGFRKSFV
jgi:hypothetical protein